MAMKEWATSPETKEFLDKLKQDRLDIMQGWARGNFTAQTMDATCQKNSEHIGMVATIDDILSWVKDLTEDA